MEGDLTSTQHNQPEEVALPPMPVLERHPNEIGLHTATLEFRKMQEQKLVSSRVGTLHQLD